MNQDVDWSSLIYLVGALAFMLLVARRRLVGRNLGWKVGAIVAWIAAFAILTLGISRCTASSHRPPRDGGDRAPASPSGAVTA